MSKRINTVSSSGFADDGTEMTRPVTPRNVVDTVYHHMDDMVDDLVECVEDEIEEAAKASREFRRTWVPVIKSTLSSLADVIGDWVFYFRTKNGDDGLDIYEQPIYIFCLISSILSGLAIVGIILKNCSCPCSRRTGVHESVFRKNCLARINWIMGLEMFLEDIPQVALTTMVLYTKRGGVWSPVAVFNVTTSAFNFTFNILDMLMPLEEHHVEAVKAQTA